MFKYKFVILVDDNEIFNITHQKVIELNQFSEKTLVFQSGQEALDYLKLNEKNIEELPEIIFLDINMPIMDGFQFLEIFEKYDELVRSRCRIIMLSSSISPKDIDRAASSIYVKKYFNKPLTARYLNAITV